MNASDWFTKEIEILNKDIDSLTYKYVLEFSENVYEILDRKGIKNKNKYLAEKLNCSPAYITKIFNGNSNFTIKKMIEIAAALEFDLEINLRPKLKSVVIASKDKFRIKGGSTLKPLNANLTKEPIYP
jgi:transcriptional regulator with XRE-family HTH domain